MIPNQGWACAIDQILVMGGLQRYNPALSLPPNSWAITTLIDALLFRYRETLQCFRTSIPTPMLSNSWIHSIWGHNRNSNCSIESPHILRLLRLVSDLVWFVRRVDGIVFSQVDRFRSPWMTWTHRCSLWHCVCNLAAIHNLGCLSSSLGSMFSILWCGAWCDWLISVPQPQSLRIFREIFECYRPRKKMWLWHHASKVLSKPMGWCGDVGRHRTWDKWFFLIRFFAKYTTEWAVELWKEQRKSASLSKVVTFNMFSQPNND